MSTVKADNFTWKTGEATAQRGSSVTGPQIAYGVAKAYCSYNGTTTTIRGSYNISSVTKSTVGAYDDNFTTSFVDNNYAATYGTKYLDDGAAGSTGVFTEGGRIANVITVSSVRITHGNYTGTLYEVLYSWVAVHR